MKDRSRVAAIDAYTRYIRMYALSHLAATAGDASAGMRVDLCASDLAASPLALPTHAAKVLGIEYGAAADMPQLLAEYWAMMEEEWRRTRDAKAKDARRGAKIIPDYNDVHASADTDKVVLWMKAKAAAAAQPHRSKL